MKKMILGILVGATLTLFSASCGEKLLTEEQVQAEIQKGLEAGKPAIEQEEADKQARGEDLRAAEQSENESLEAELAAELAELGSAMER
jgi:hypothetical protein